MGKSQSELYAGADLYIYSRHIFVEGNFPAISGSKLIDRDFTGARKKILDPFGNKAFWRDVRRFGLPDTKMCSCRTHAGSPWLPKDEFAKDKGTPDGLDRYCRKCRSDLAFARRVKELAKQGKEVRPWHRQNGTPKRRSDGESARAA